MKKSSVHFLVQSAVIAALYFVLTHLQNILLPNTTSWAIQCRLSEALCVLALFSPAAIPGLTIGCLLFNLSYAMTLPLDWCLGSLATLGAAASMWFTRKITFKGYPVLSMLMPALWNAVLIGIELTQFIGGSLAINALYVALGELIVLVVVGTILYYAIKNRKLEVLISGKFKK